jgi:hypothetical protein
MEITLLAASVKMPPTSEVNAEYTSLVPVNRLALTARTSARDYSAYPNDNIILSDAADDEGSFHFQSEPLKNFGNDGSSSRWGSFLSAHVFGSGWYTHNALFQYALHASMPSPAYGRLINVYV